jgi:hypothetical protein
MAIFSCNPHAFVQSLTKSQRKALADVLRLGRSKDGKQGALVELSKALEHAK